jgi:hypothetical protein
VTSQRKINVLEGTQKTIVAFQFHASLLAAPAKSKNFFFVEYEDGF